MTEHKGKYKTRQNKKQPKNKEFIVFFFPSSIQVKGTLCPLQNLSRHEST